ncbi:MAG: Lrp/AsnC ligand binding domain-containing protein [Candidatus Thorarchaeota archaeon]|nr:Lrp/AsnC ligand binding domain-containing protein [Candidatus Thorarchaeota archaeon]
MSSRSQRPVGRRAATTIFYFLALGSGILRAFSVGFDLVAINTVFGDPIVYGFMSQWVSFATTFGIVAILSIKSGKGDRRRSIGFNLDPDFGRLRLLPRKPMLYLVLAGVFAGISTFLYYTIIGATDASAVLPYGQLVIIYLLMGDLWAEKDTPTIIELQSIMSILIGVLLVGVEPGGFNLMTLFIVLVPMNMASALVTFYQKKTKQYEIEPGLRVDSLNMRVWMLLVLNIVMSILMIPLMPTNFLESMMEYFTPLLIFMVGSSVATFLGLVMYIRALGRGSMSVVNSLSSISVVLGIPMTLIGNLLIPGAFGVITTDAFVWVLKVFGVTLVMIGVIALQATEVRSIVLIKVKPLSGDILPDLFDIRGVQSAAGIAGNHDYILSIKSRSLGKTRTNILKKIQGIHEIESIETLVVLRDYK